MKTHRVTRKQLLAAAFWCLVGTGMGLPPGAQAQAGKLAVEAGRTKGSVSIDWFNRLLAGGASGVHLIDASSAREFAAGSIKGASNVPINQLEKQIASLPSDKPIVFFCATGARASEAYDTVKLLRGELEVYFLDAQVQIRADGTPLIR